MSGREDESASGLCGGPDSLSGLYEPGGGARRVYAPAPAGLLHVRGWPVWRVTAS